MIDTFGAVLAAAVGYVAGYAHARYIERARQSEAAKLAAADKLEPVSVPEHVFPCACGVDGCACERATTPQHGICSRCRFGHHTYRRERPEARELRRRHSHTELCYLTEYGATTYRIQCGKREGEAEP